MNFDFEKDSEGELMMDQKWILRVKNIQKVLEEAHEDIVKEAREKLQELLKSKKSRAERQVIKENVVKTHNFIEGLSSTFFQMLSDPQHIGTTTEIDIYAKLDRYRKDLQTSLRKVIKNLKEVPLNPIEKEELELKRQKEDKERRSGMRGKNVKIGKQKTWPLQDWILVNFSNPHPTLEEKQMLEKKTGLSMSTINHWFINTREREIKTQFKN